MAMLAIRISTQIRTDPSFFGTATIGEIQGVGWVSGTGSIIPSFSRSFTAFLLCHVCDMEFSFEAALGESPQDLCLMSGNDL